MKRTLLFGFYLPLIAVLIAGCTNVATRMPTLPISTDTEKPTSTISTPTSAHTPLPSATANATATAMILTTEIAESVKDELDSLLGGTGIPYHEGHLIWKQTHSMKIDMLGPEKRILDIDDKPEADNFILKSDVIWTGSGLTVCGAIFHSEQNIEKGAQYQIAFLRINSNKPAWVADFINFGEFAAPLSDVKFTDVLKFGNGVTNQFILISYNEQFTLYINRTYQGGIDDSAKLRPSGFIAFFGFQDSGNGSCEFKNSWIWALNR